MKSVKVLSLLFLVTGPLSARDSLKPRSFKSDLYEQMKRCNQFSEYDAIDSADRLFSSSFAMGLKPEQFLSVFDDRFDSWMGPVKSAGCKAFAREVEEYRRVLNVLNSMPEVKGLTLAEILEKKDNDSDFALKTKDILN